MIVNKLKSSKMPSANEANFMHVKQKSKTIQLKAPNNLLSLSSSSLSLKNLDHNYNLINNNNSNNSDKFHYVKNFNQSSLAQYLKKSVLK